VYDNLIDQAELLATIDTRRPKETNLRRAVSAAYYAVFHLLVDESCIVFFGSQNSQRPYRHTLARAFSHSVMRSACGGFGSGNLKAAVIKGLPRNRSGQYAIPGEIQDIAALFCELQEKRHLADYDRAERFKRSEVLMLIDQTRVHVANFRGLTQSDDRRFFLACLWAWKDLANR